MFSLKPKTNTGAQPTATPPSGDWTKAALVIALALIAIVGYSLYSTRTVLQDKISTFEEELEKLRKEHATTTADLASDLDVVTTRIGVTTQELDRARALAQRLKQEQEEAEKRLSSELATKASSSDVVALRQEASTQLAEVQQDATSKIGAVSGEVTNVKQDLATTRQDLAASRREIIDVKQTLSQQIARNSSELSELRKKGERDYVEFDIRKGKRNQMQRVADVQLELRKTDTKKQKYDIIIGVDDSRLEKKDRTANEPVQFLVGRDRLRYEIVVNFVDKDRVRGYLSTPKDKVLSAERPTFRPQ